MNKPYYQEIGLTPRYRTKDVLEDIYDDRQLEEDTDQGVVGTWENLKQQLEPEVKD